MASEIIVVPTYKRDELLYLCLEAIRHESDIPVWVYSDRAYQSYDLSSATRKFGATLYTSCNHDLYGNSFAVIEALKMSLYGACGTPDNPDIVHLIEDDTLLHPGYFQWARHELSRPNVAAVCGGLGNTVDTWYTSPCASWNAEHLRKCLELIPPGYLEATTREEMQKILDEYGPFKKSHFRYGSAEQDGFFLRCIEHFGWKTKFPEKPLASHMGWWSNGYNRSGHPGPEGATFEERVAACRRALNDKKFRVAMFGQRVTDLEMEGMNQ